MLLDKTLGTIQIMRWYNLTKIMTDYCSFYFTTISSCYMQLFHTLKSSSYNCRWLAHDSFQLTFVSSEQWRPERKTTTTTALTTLPSALE